VTSSSEARPIEPPAAGDEASTLIGCLERERAIFAWKTGGLDAAGLRATAAASSITLGGLVKHLALIEDDYFSHRLHGRSPGPPWDAVDWDADPDWEWRTGAEDAPAALYGLWRDAADRSRASLDEALSGGGLDGRVKCVADERGEAPNLRRLLMDVIEEYARHNGHADLIRESIDGVVGEDPPRS
jgi:hypothetical protein